MRKKDKIIMNLQEIIEASGLKFSRDNGEDDAYKTINA